MMRALISACLCLVLVLTSHSAAMARGSTEVGEQIVICSGTMVITIYVDADGEPTEAPHLCPDCALHLLAAVAPPASALSLIPTLHALTALPKTLSHSETSPVRAIARAPPAVM